MARTVRRLRASSRRLALVSGLLLAWLATSGVAKAEDLTLSFGRWTVESRGFGWPCRLEALEIRESNRAGEPLLVGFERGEDGRSRPWGSSRIDRRATGPSASRWFSASWPSGPVTVLIQVRPEASGRLLAIVRERSRDRGIGDLVRQVVLAPSPPDDRPVLEATLGPKGKVGVAARFDSDGTISAKVAMTGVFVAREDGGEARQVALPDGFATAVHPCWSPDGRWVAFAAFDSAGRDPLIRVALATGGPSTAVAAGSTPTWSRDGSRIAYVASGRADYATDWSALGRNDERIDSVRLNGPKAGETEVLARGIWPRWSPLDDQLAFVGRADANWDIYLRSVDGLSLSRLTDDPALDTQPAWSADGRSILFLSDRGNRWDLYRVRPQAGARADRLTDHVRREDSPSPSPDGRHVAFVDGRGHPEGSILILDLDRGTVRAFPEHSDGDRDPAWSPDGRSIAFISRRPGPLLHSGGSRP
jgi:Tol biopolymer transport system component